MTRRSSTPSGIERTFLDDEIIVSKTDVHGKITYANEVFLRVSGYSESELLGQPHSIIRHPDMPRAVFKLLWETIQAGKEIFAYVLNMAKNGDHYWVLAHVTPTFDATGAIIGYHSNRRTADARALAEIRPIYQLLLAEERRYSGKPEQVEASSRLLVDYLARERKTYDEFVWSLAA